MEGKCEDWVLVEKGGGKNVENVDVVSMVVERKIRWSEIVAVRIFETLPFEVDIRAISNVVFFAPLSISSVLRIFISVREKFRFSNNEIPCGVGGVKKI